MKGVVVEIDNAKCIVLFNNGKIGSLPKPPNCEVGMIITVNFNRKIIALPVAVIVVLLAAGVIVWFALRARSMSPERFCNSPFLRKDIILPLSEYADFDALFAHLGNPVREFSPDHSDRFYDKRKDDDDKDERFYDYHTGLRRNRGRGFNYLHYGIIAYYSQDNRKVFISEIILNSKEVIYNGNFPSGTTGKKQDDSFSSRDKDMRFAMDNKVLAFKFNGRNQLSCIRIVMDS